MARAIDEKIVQMKMDNSDFTSKVRSTLEAFRSLTGGMNKIDSTKISGPANGLNAISNSAKGTNSALETIAAGVSSLQGRFSVLGQVGQQAISMISNNLIATAGRVIKGLSLGPIMDGYDEYAEGLQSINVIMNNVPGAKLKDVQGTLATLNTYADQTIYSFKDMTSSMGTFTAAGVGLDDSAIAIEGIGNLAASSGSNTQQMSMAMYQLSQALAAGKVGLQDWNSVVNAGMGGQKFQKALSATAKELGHGRNEAVSFRDSLQDGWLTSEVLLKTLAKFKDDKSMQEAATKVRTFGQAIDTTKEALGSAWVSVWTNIIGDSEEAPEIWTKVANAIQLPIGAMENYLKVTSKTFHDTGGRTAIINALTNVFKDLGKILGTISDAFGKVFPPASGKRLTDMAKSFEQLTNKLRVSNTDLKNLSTTFTAVFTVIKWGVDAVKMVAGALLSLVPKNLISMILQFTAKLGSMILQLDKGTPITKLFGNALDSLGGPIKAFHSAVGVTNKVLAFLGQSLKDMAPLAKMAWDYLANGAVSAFKAVSSAVSKSSLTGGDAITGGLLAGVILSVKRVSSAFGKLTEMFKSSGAVTKIVDNVKSVLGQLTTSLSAFTTSIRIVSIIGIAGAILGLAVALKILASIQGTDVFKTLEMLGVMLFAMTKTLTVLGDMKGSVVRATVAAGALVILGLAVTEIAIALKIFESIKPEEVAKSMLVLGGTIGILMLALDMMSKQSVKSLPAAAALLILGGAIDVIALALVGLSFISAEGLTRAVVSIGAILAELAVFVMIVNRLKFGMGTAISIAILAAAITAMTIPIIALGFIPYKVVVQGLEAMGALLAGVAIFALIISHAKMGASALSIALIAVALNLMVVPILALSKIPVKDLMNSLVGLVGALAAITLAMGLAEHGLGGALAITVMAFALNVMLVPLMALSRLNISQLAIMLGALAGTLAILGLAGALLSPVVLPLMGLGAAMMLIGGGAALAGLGVTLFAAGLVALVGVGVAAVGALITAIGMLLDGVVTLAPKMLAAFSAVIAAMVGAIVTNIPLIVNGFLQLVQAILDAILTYGPSIVETFLQIILQLGQVVSDNIIPIVNMISQMVINMAVALGQNAEPLISAGIQLIVDLMNGMADGIRAHQDELVQAVLNIVESILEVVVTALAAVLQTLFGWIPGFSGAISAAGEGGKEALRAAFGIDQVAGDKGDQAVAALNSKQKPMGDAGSLLAQAGQAGMDTLDASGMGGKKGTNFADGVGSKRQNAFDNGSLIAQGARGGAQGVGLDGTGANKGQEFANGLSRKGGDANIAGQHVSTQGRDGAGSGDYYGKGQDAGAGYVGGIGSYSGTGGPAWQAGSLLAQSALQGLQKKQNSHSPSKATRKLGVDYGDGYALGIDDRQGSVIDSARSLAAQALSVMANAAGDIQDALEDNMNLSPTITPVLDLSKMNNQSLLLGGSQSVPLGQNSQNGQPTVKLDTSDLDAKLDALASGSSSPVTVNFKVYGTLDDVTARKWAPQIAESLDRVRKGG